MRKSLITLITVVVLACSLLFSASAASFEGTAEQLNELGLFQGVDGNFQLERQPSRAEAVTMLVRFLGLEDEAQSGEYSHPFTDVPDWASPYVAIAYELGYTAGVTDTTFNPQDICSAQMYVTFILRALGYTDDDAASTLWAEAFAFGMRIGVVDELLLTGSFTRGHMTAVSYLALAVAPADGEFDMLLDKLAADGAVDENNAELLKRRFELIDEFNRINADFADETSIAMIIEADVDVSLMGETVSTYMFMEMAMILDVDSADMQFAMMMEVLAPVLDIDIEAEVYVLDGYMYVYADDEKNKMSLDDAMGMDFGELLAMTEMTDMANLSEIPAYMIDNITKSEDGGLTVYTVVLAGDVMNAIIGQVFDMMGDFGPADFGGMSFENTFFQIAVGADGVFSKMAMSTDATLEIEGQIMTMSMDMEYEITAVGTDVVIEFPDDLDEYLEFDPNAAGGGTE